MRIATWNIAHRKECLYRWLDKCKCKPDVVALQKPWGAFPTEELESAGYRYHALSRYERWGGVAILSRNKPEEVPVGLPWKDKLGSRLLTVEVNGIEVSSVYAPYGDDIKRRADWFEALKEHVQSRGFGSRKRVLCGDFNVSTERRGRTGDRKTEDEELRRKLSALCDLGLIDLYMDLPMDGGDRFTCRGSQGSFKLSKLQYILGTSSVADRLRGAPTVGIDYRRPGLGNGSPWWCPLVVEVDD